MTRSTSLISTKSAAPRALLVALQTPDFSDDDVAISLAELSQLLAGLGIGVEGTIVQRRRDALATTVLGAGKLDELRERLTPHPEPDQAESSQRIEEQGPWLLVFDGELTPGQQRTLSRLLEVEVVDRTQVILTVFRERARTRVAQLEIELARLNYEAPRIRDSESLLAEQAGGGGRGGRGDTGAALKKQQLRRRISELRRELEQAGRAQLTRRGRRQQICRVALVGYTNAGKSSWMRALTGSDVEVEDALFATLDTTVRTLAPASSPRVVVADTVGFLRNLPNHLLASFRSTLDEALDADLLLCVVDASDPHWKSQLVVTEQVLSDVGAEGIPRLVLLNKIDQLSSAERVAAIDALPEALLVSSRSERDLAEVRRAILGAIDAELEFATLRVPYTEGALLDRIHQAAHVVKEHFDQTGVRLRLRAKPEFLKTWRKRLAGTRERDESEAL